MSYQTKHETNGCDVGSRRTAAEPPRYSLWRTQVLSPLVVLTGMVVTCPAVQARDVTYYYVDPQGSVLATADAVGQITSASDFTPFGIRVPAAVTNQIGYIGQIEDVESGLDYFQARYYDPLTGRFLSEDPLPMEDGDGFDRYSYGNNSPYVFVDPSGMDGENTTPTPPGLDEPPVVVTASYVDPPFIAPFGGQGDNPPQPGVDPVQRPQKECTGYVDLTAIGGNQAMSISMVMRGHPPKGSVAISPARFGLPFPADPDAREKTQTWLHNNARGVRIEIPGITTGKEGPKGTTFSIGDIGNSDIRNSPAIRFDIYRWKTKIAAIKWGRRTMRVIIRNLPSGTHCPF